MQYINCTQTRQKVSEVLKTLNKLYEKDFSRSYWLKDLEESVHYIKKQADNSSRKNIRRFSAGFSLVNISLACIGFLSLSVYNKEEEDQIFPIDWLASNSRPNANFVLQCMLTQLTNFVLSTVLLFERGLDNQARVLNRQIIELTEQILVLVYSQESFKEYIKGHDEESSESVWRSLFSKGRLSKKLCKMESSLGFDDKLCLYLTSIRKNNYKYYSQTVHHSFVATTAGSYFGRLDSSGEIYLGIFGGENRAIEGTLENLNYVLWYFLICFFAVIEKNHGITTRDSKSGFWMETFMLYFCVKAICSPK